MADDAGDFDLLELMSADHVTLRELVGQPAFPEALSRHLATERDLLYPSVAKEEVASTDELAEMRSLDRDLEIATTADEPGEIRRTLDTHVAVQEALFDVIREQVGRDRLVELGSQVADAMEEAPTHLHPGLPDHGPLQRVASDVAATIDQVEDSFKHRGT